MSAPTGPSAPPSPDLGAIPWENFRPVYRDSSTGARTADPAPAGVVALDRLATFLGPVAVMRDHAPDSPWARLDRVPVSRPPRPVAPSDPDELAPRFADAVEASCADAGVIAVAVSGGIDSLAVLAVARSLPGRRVVAVVSDAIDDQGRSPARLVRDQLAALGGGIELRVVPYRLDGFRLPEWRPSGPGFYSTPREHRALAEAAADGGADVLLHGGGADHLLAYPRTLPAGLARRTERLGRALPGGRPGGSRTVTRWWDGATRLRGERAARLLWAGRTSRRYRVCAGTDLLTEEFAAGVDAGFLRFSRAQVAHHVDQGWSLARGLLFERLYPHDALPPATRLPLRSPFYVPSFARYCWQLPMRARWQPGESGTYRRSKGLLVGLVPPRARAALPDTSMISLSHALAYWRAETVEPRLLLEHGVLRPDWSARARSVYDIQMVAECERWLAGALETGASVARAASPPTAGGARA